MTFRGAAKGTISTMTNSNVMTMMHCPHEHITAALAWHVWPVPGRVKWVLWQPTCTANRWSKEVLRNLRAEGDKDSLVKDHAAVTAGHADLRVGCFAVNDLCGCHIRRVQADLRVKPNSCSYAKYENSS